MITIEILKTIDQSLLNTFTFNQDKVKLGNHKLSDLIIFHSELLYCDLYLSDEMLFISCNSTILINGKKISGEKALKINDEVSFNNTVFKIKEFNANSMTKESLLREKYQEISETRPDISLVMDSIENEILKIQTIENKK